MSGPSIRVAVSGAAGRMGREVVRAVLGAEDTVLAAAVDHQFAGEDAGVLAGAGGSGIEIQPDLAAALASCAADVLVDFTVPASAMSNVRAAIACGVSPVVGTTGISQDDLTEAARLAESAGIGALVAPNFAIGAVLMMEFAARAAAYLPDVEIIELHHEQKLDSPSGTAMLTARRIAEARRSMPAGMPVGAVEKASGARGARVNGVTVHSVRLPGFVAHQEVIFGGIGQTLTIRHDSLDRRSFMPGVLLAVRRVRELRGLVVGLESLLRDG